MARAHTPGHMQHLRCTVVPRAPVPRGRGALGGLRLPNCKQKAHGSRSSPPLLTPLHSFLAAAGPSLLPQNHRLHHPLLPLGQGDPAGAAGMKRERSAGQSSPSPGRSMHLPPGQPQPQAIPRRLEPPWGHATPVKVTPAPPSGWEKPLLGHSRAAMR